MTDIVVLVVTANKQRLAVSQVEIKLENVRILVGWCGSIETKTAGINTVADGSVVGRVASRYVRQEVHRRRVDAGGDAIRIDVRLVYLRGSQAAKARRRARRTCTIAGATRSAVTDDTLSNVRQGYNLYSAGGSRFPETFISKEEERPIAFDWAAD